MFASSAAPAGETLLPVLADAQASSESDATGAAQEVGSREILVYKTATCGCSADLPHGAGRRISGGRARADRVYSTDAEGAAGDCRPGRAGYADGLTGDGGARSTGRLLRHHSLRPRRQHERVRPPIGLRYRNLEPRPEYSLRCSRLVAPRGLGGAFRQVGLPPFPGLPLIPRGRRFAGGESGLQLPGVRGA